jgi:hypothetical protein
MRSCPLIAARAWGARPSPVPVALASLLASLGALLAFAPASAAQVYFTAFYGEGGTGIERAAFDGTNRETLQFQPTGFADDLALDVPDGKVYWTESAGRMIWRSNLNGTEAQVVLIDSAEPYGIALDLAQAKIYWTDGAGVKRANLDGSGEETLTTEHARGFIALALSARRMYWADEPLGLIRSAAMEVSPVVTNIVEKQPCPFGIAVDEAHEKVYWLGLEMTAKIRCATHASLARANLDGSGVEAIVKHPASGEGGGLVVDPSAGALYWSASESDEIETAHLDGSGERVLFRTGTDVPVGLAVESADPHPLNTAPPVIEGSPVVGAPLFCNPGSWTGIGPVGFFYQWAVAGMGALEGAITSTFVAPSELAGAQLQCTVTATDSVETTTLASPAVTVGPYPAPAMPPSLVAAIALARVSARNPRASVPIFTNLAGVAVLEAIPGRAARGSRSGARSSRSGARSSRSGAHAALAHARVRAPAHVRRHRPASQRTIVARRSVNAGRSSIALSGLVRGTSYTLRLTVESSDGQTATSTATLRVARR